MNARLARVGQAAAVARPRIGSSSPVLPMARRGPTLAEAHQAIAGGDYIGARAMLLELLDGAAPRVDVEHALAIVERRLGNLSASRQHFEHALRARPADPAILNNFANYLRDTGDLAGAVEHYARALDAQPAYVDALVNISLTLKHLGRLTDAVPPLERAVVLAPRQVRAWHALGVVLWAAGRLDEAADALDRAIALSPEAGHLLHARARLEAERGRPSVPLYRRAFGACPGDSEVRLGLGVAEFEEGNDAEALAQLGALVREQPTWVKGHAALAHVRWQLGELSSFADSFVEAIRAHPADVPLRVGHFGTLMRTGRYAEVLQSLQEARAAIDAPELFDRYEAVCASECGEAERAERAFQRQIGSGDRGLLVARMRHLLRNQRAPEAARLGESIVQDPAATDVWPYLGLAWRLIGDRRAKWLYGDGRLVSYVDCPDARQRLPRLAAALRAAHRARTHPMDQSVRGGTQTDGQLLLRSEPEFTSLRGVIERAVAEFIRALPAADPGHPFLRHRQSRASLAASYSVRLRAHGFHINHMHPDAWISCCFYVDVPETIGRDERDPAGWLVLGAPPAELGLPLEPLARIQPRPGHLALFPSILWHGTAPFREGERLSVVCDLVPA